MINFIKNILLVNLIFLSFPSLANDGSIPIKYEPIISTSSILQVIFVLILILILIYSIFWILKKKYFFQSSVRSVNQINIISSLSIGPRERIFVIEIADKQFLLSSTANNINLIKSFDEKILDSDIDLKNNTFANLLSKYRNNL